MINEFLPKPFDEIANWTKEAKFHHDPTITNFRRYFRQPEWKITIDKLKKLNIENMIIASGKGFRNVGSYVLSDELEVPCSAVGKIEDELKFERFHDFTGSDDVVEYQRDISRGKFHREEIRAHENLRRDSLLISFDEFILIWKNGNLEALEKPKSEAEAIDQIWMLTSGARYIVSNTACVGNPESVRNGKAGIAVHFIPMRIKCENEREREMLFEHWLKLYRKAARGEEGKPTPGGVTLLHRDLQPYQEVLISKNLSKGVLPFGFDRRDYLKLHGESRLSQKPLPNRAYLKFADSLLDGYRGVPYLALPTNIKEEIGIAIGGLSLVGLREALERFILMKDWASTSYREESGDHLRQQLFNELMVPVLVGALAAD